MTLEVYYPQDIRNALQAAAQSCGAALLVADRGGGDFARGYGEGYQDALITIALAFGLVRLDSHDEGIEWPPRFLFPEARRFDPNTLPRPPPF